MSNANIEFEEHEEFMQSLSAGLNGAETEQDFELSYRLSYLSEQYEKRSGRGRALVDEHIFSAQFVLQQAAQRLFPLVWEATSSMAGMFNEPEMKLILNSNPNSVWRYQVGTSLAGNVADDRGVEDLDELVDGSELKVLLQKLLGLTSLQTVALVDLCEQFWRSPSDCSLGDAFLAMGLELME
jgi:hypothetical protein